MNFNEHSKLKGKHAFLSPSNYHWLRYSPDKMVSVFENYKAAEQGTKLHDFARQAIELGIKLPKKPPTTLALHVNDAIGFMMSPEVVLYYSDYCFGCADAISFHKNILRIHDLKTGVTPASMDQLLIYAGIFCLEYNVNPDKIKIELRIYQCNKVLVHVPEPGEVMGICDRIRESNALLIDLYGKTLKGEWS